MLPSHLCDVRGFASCLVDDPLLARTEQFLSACESKIACANPGRGMFTDRLFDQHSVGESDVATRQAETAARQEGEGEGEREGEREAAAPMPIRTLPFANALEQVACRHPHDGRWRPRLAEAPWDDAVRFVLLLVSQARDLDPLGQALEGCHLGSCEAHVAGKQDTLVFEVDLVMVVSSRAELATRHA